MKVPPFFIFPRVNYRDYFVNGSINSSDGDASWMTASNFIKFLNHFKKFAKPTSEYLVLLLLDNHESHISIESLKFRKDNNIILLSFPPHTTHKLQHLDVAIYGPMKTNFNSAMDSWKKLPENADKTVSIYDIPKKFSSIYFKSFSDSNIISVFKKIGICPFNRFIFTDDDFAGNYAFDRPAPDTDTSIDYAASAAINYAAPATIINAAYAAINHTALAANAKKLLPPVSSNNPVSLNNTGESNAIDSSFPIPSPMPSTSNQLCKINIYFESLRPYPKACPPKTNQNRRNKKSEILTSSSVKDVLTEKTNDLEEKKSEKKAVLAKKKKSVVKKKLFTKQKLDKSQKRKRIQKSESESECEDYSLFIYFTFIHFYFYFL